MPKPALAACRTVFIKPDAPRGDSLEIRRCVSRYASSETLAHLHREMMDESRLRLFVYGTLKRGFANHRKLCQGVISVEAAEIRGKLYELPAGYPALVIPESSILAKGSSDLQADVAAQYGADPASQVTEAGLPSERAGWDRVHGEVLTFDDPARRLPVFDELEDFRPGRRSLYQRVLATVTSQASRERISAWTYVMKDPGAHARRLSAGRWPRPGS